MFFWNMYAIKSDVQRFRNTAILAAYFEADHLRMRMSYFFVSLVSSLLGRGMKSSILESKAIEWVVVARRSSKSGRPAHTLGTEDRHTREFLVKLARIRAASYLRFPRGADFASH